MGGRRNLMRALGLGIALIAIVAGPARDATAQAATAITYNVPFWTGSTSSSIETKASVYTSRGGRSRAEIREVGTTLPFRAANSSVFYPANSDTPVTATYTNLPAFHGYEVRMCVRESGVPDTCGPWRRVYTYQATARPTNPTPQFGPAYEGGEFTLRDVTFSTTLTAPREAGQMFLERDRSGVVRRDPMGAFNSNGASSGTLSLSKVISIPVGQGGVSSIRHRVCWEPAFVPGPAYNTPEEIVIRCSAWRTSTVPA